MDLLVVQGTLQSLFQHHSSKASILQHSAFFTVQLSPVITRQVQMWVATILKPGLPRSGSGRIRVTLLICLGAIGSLFSFIHSLRNCVSLSFLTSGCAASWLLSDGFLQLQWAGAALLCVARCGLLIAVASLVAGHRPWVLALQHLQLVGSVLVTCWLRCSVACGIFPDQGSNPCPLQWQAGSSPPDHQGSPHKCFLKC